MTLGRRLRRFAVMVAQATPVIIGHWMAIARWRLLRSLAGVTRKIGAVAAFMSLVVITVMLGREWLEVLALVPVLVLTGVTATAFLQRPIGLFLLSFRKWPFDGIAPARETLQLLGLGREQLARISAELAAGREVTLASFDQENRLLSLVGPIPYFKNDLITQDEFIPRYRHRLDVVAAFGVVTIRKAYQTRMSMENEAHAMAALAHVPGVPRIVHLDWRGKVMYQSYLYGENLGRLMAANGATDELQHDLLAERPHRGRWMNPKAQSSVRRDAIEVLRTVIPERCVEEIGELMVRIHRAGVSLGDVKYGNVLLHDGHPVLCDFDWSRVFGPQSLVLLDRRDDERDLFNFLFGGSMPTIASAKRELEQLAIERPALGAATVLFGAGYRFGSRWSQDAGTGRWWRVRPHLPPISGRLIVDLGSHFPIPLIEMLRMGARRLTTYQSDPITQRFLAAYHQLAELIDNRKYDLRIVPQRPTGAGEIGRGADVITAFGAFDGASAEMLAKILPDMWVGVQDIVLHDDVPRPPAGDSTLVRQLKASGFTIERSVVARDSDRTFLLATRG